MAQPVTDEQIDRLMMTPKCIYSTFSVKKGPKKIKIAKQCQCLLRVEWCCKYNVSFDHLWGLFHFTIQDRVTNDTSRISNISQRLMQSLNTSHYDSLLYISQTSDLGKGLQQTTMRFWDVLFVQIAGCHFIILDPVKSKQKQEHQKSKSWKHNPTGLIIDI